MKKPKVDIEEVLLRFKEMDISHDEYEFYYELVIAHYERMIYGLIGRRFMKEDFFHDCILQIPSILASWEPGKGAFSTHLTWRLRGYLQTLDKQDNLVGYNARSEKHTAKKKGVEVREFAAIRTDGMTSTSFFSEDSSNNPFMDKLNFVKPTIDSDIFVDECLEAISDIKDVDIWIDYYIKDVTAKEIAAAKGISFARIHFKIKQANRLVNTRLRNLLEDKRMTWIKKI